MAITIQPIRNINPFTVFKAAKDASEAFAQSIREQSSAIADLSAVINSGTEDVSNG